MKIEGGGSQEKKNSYPVQVYQSVHTQIYASHSANQLLSLK